MDPILVDEITQGSGQIFPSLIGEFGRLIDLPDLSLDDNGLCELEIDEHWIIRMEAAENGALILSSDVTVNPDLNELDLLRDLARANFLLAREGGPILTVREGHPGVVLVSCIPGAYAQLPELAAHFQAMVEASRLWQDHFAKPNPEPPSEDSLSESIFRA